MKTLKLKSFASLSTISQPAKVNPEKWSEFLSFNGHTKETFSYLPEHLQLSLKVSFAKKQ